MNKLIINDKEIEIPNELLDKVKEVLQESKPKTSKLYWKPEEDEEYWCINGMGNVDRDDWDGGDYDSGALATGSIFRTKEEALVELEKRKALVRVKKYIVDNGLEFEPDWDDYGDKSIIGFNVFSWHFTVEEIRFTKYSDFYYFRSKEDARQVIKACEDDLKIVWGIE